MKIKYGLILYLIAILFLNACATAKKEAVVQGPLYPSKLTPAIKESYFHAESLYNSHDFTGAKEAFYKFIEDYEYNPITDRAYYVLGEIALAENDYMTAVAQYEQAYSRVYSPEVTPNARYKAAFCWYNLDKFSKSLELLINIVRDDAGSKLRLQIDSLAVRNSESLGHPLDVSIRWHLFLFDDYNSFNGAEEELSDIREGEEDDEELSQMKGT